MEKRSHASRRRVAGSCWANPIDLDGDLDGDDDESMNLPQRTNTTAQLQRTITTAQRHRTNTTAQRHRTNTTAQRHRTNTTAQRHRTNTTARRHAPPPSRAPSPPAPSPRKPKAAARDGEPPAPEKRLRRFRAQPPQSFQDVYARAMAQRFFVLGRRRGGPAECPHETFVLAGSTGNVYKVRVDRQPTCDCPHAAEGNQCKHVLYILARVLHAPFDLVYQLALLSSELCTIFAAAPDDTAQTDAAGTGNTTIKRKPVQGDCPICFCELDATSPESVTWCRSACGQNFHKQCSDMWASTKQADGRVPCPLCRAEWAPWDVGTELDVLDGVRLGEAIQSEGYANVAGQLGISGLRDTSSYSDWHWRRHWRRHARRRRG